MKCTLAITVIAGLLGAASIAQAGQFKNVNIMNVASNSCIPVNSTAQNQGPVNTAAMQIEIFEFIPAVSAGYRCCIGANATGRALNVRLLNLSGVPIASATTAVNGAGCPGTFHTLTPGFAYQCTVSTAPNQIVGLNAHYQIRICRQ